ncbi:Aminopeptidase N [Ooceraea biroi]|uniref:Aminopeptidase N n=1 Tax=Ooceraea biroi TaxID=2015173 RepID=A0A026W4Y2_OOCBI|nr:Aminopeptidase N [Ooceraea biroi]
MSKYLVVLLLSSSLTFIVGLSSKSQLESESGHAPYNRFTYHLPNDVVPLFYEIDLIVSLHNENLIVRSDSTIKIEVYNETKVISLHYVGYIRNVMIISEIGTPVSVPSKSYIKETETVDLHFENVISPGRYKLVIQYISKSLKSLFKIPYFTNTTESWFIYTVFQPYGARYVFPCWDEPAIEAAFAVKARYQTDDTTDPEAEDWDESKHQLSSFHSLETSKLHIYHVEITLYPSEICLDLRYVPKIKSVIWCREHMNPLFQVAYNTTRSVMKSLSEYTMSQKQLNLDYKVIPGIRKDSIGNWKILIYREGAISYDKDLDPIAQQMEITRLITRTIANLWFHSMVSPFRWKHFWLNEALAAFFQTKVLKDDMLELFLVQTLHESLYLDTNDGEINDNFEMIPLENYMSLEDTLRFSFTISLKAPAIFYMLEHMINPHVFREGLASYFVIHMSTHATSDNLWDAMQLVLNGEHIQLHPHFKLKHVMRTWIRQKHYPIVNVKRNHDHEIVISREPDRLDSTTFTFQKWWIPITFTILKDYNFNNTKPLAWLHPRRSSITLNPIRKSDWIVVNIQQTGYYRVKYERWNWNLIANYLNSEKYIFIHVLNRAKLIDDAYYFMMTHQLDYHIFIKLTSYLSQETDYTAWYPMFKIFEYLSKFLPFSENHRFKTHMRTILDSLFLKIKLLEHPYGSNSINILRHEASKWACVLDNAYCKRAAHIKLQLHLENPEKHKLSPSLKEWTYCNGLPVEDSVTQMKMWTHLIQTTNSHRIIYKYLTCNTKFDNIHMFLKFILNDYTMKYNERINAFYSAIARYAHDYMRIILKDFERYNPKTMSNDVTPLHYDIEVKILNHSSEDTITIIGNYTIKIMIHRETEKIIMHLSNYKVTITTHGISLICETNKSIEYVFSYALLYNGFLVVQFTTVLSPGNYTLHITKLRKVTVTANDLWAIIDKDNSSKLRDHTNPTYNIPNLKKLMHTWIKEMHYPVLKVIRNYHNNMVMMLQENHNILDRNQWWIPVTYTTQTELEFTDILPKLWLQPGVQNLIIEETVQKNEWIIANLQQAEEYYLQTCETIIGKILFALLLSSNVILIAAEENPFVKYSDYEVLELVEDTLPRNAEPQVYNMNLTLNRTPDGLSIKGQSIISFRIYIPINFLRFHYFGNITKASLQLFGNKADSERNIVSNISCIDEIAHTIDLSLEKMLEPGYLRVATPDHLWSQMQIALQDSEYENTNIILKTVMDSWTKQQNYPIVTVERNNNAEINICLYYVKSKSFSLQRSWWIPITFTIQNKFDFHNTVPYAWLTPEKSCIPLEPIRKNNWIIVNLQQTGYYRVKYEQWNWQLLAKYLNSKKYENIHVLNRAQIIDDAYYFMMTEELDCDMFFFITKYLSQELNFKAWYPMLKIFEYISPYLSFPESASLQNHMLAIINSVLERITYEESDSDDIYTIFLRQELAKWACILDDFDCKKIANIKLVEYLTDSNSM